MAAVDLAKLVKEKRFWVASFLVAWAAALQGHMMWVQRQDAFKDKFGDPDAPNRVTEQVITHAHSDSDSDSEFR